MNQKVIILLSVLVLCMGQVVANNVLIVNKVIVPQGRQATIEVGCIFDTEYTAFELQFSLPDGLTLLTDEYGYPVIEKAFDTNHILTGNLLPSNGNYKITCRSMDKLSLPTSGPLFRVSLQADANLAAGTTLIASVTASEFTRTSDSNGENLADVGFTVFVSEFRTILDENSTTLPMAEDNANVRVKYTINANEWSTICLPFAMNEAQLKTAFGSEVRLANFSSWSSDEDDKGNITRINIGFTDVTEIEANHPYLIMISSDINEFTVDGVDINVEEEPTVQVGKKKAERGYMIGSYIANTEIPENDLFLYENKFWYSMGSTKMKAFRAYFELADVLTSTENAASCVRMKISGEEPQHDYIPGDANGDGVVSYSDVVAVLNRILGGASDDNFVEAAADVNNDSMITIVDALAIVDIITKEK